MNNGELRYQSGQTLIEVIIVISVIVMLVTGLVAGTSTSLKTSQSGRSRLQATKYAEEGLEYARNLRDQSWSSFAALQDSYCLGGGASPTLVASPDQTCPATLSTPDTVYKRILTFSLTGTRMTVVSSVSFPESAETKTISLTTYLTQWK